MCVRACVCLSVCLLPALKKYIARAKSVDKHVFMGQI